MILGSEPIELGPLLSGLRKQADLTVLPAGQDPFSHEPGRAAIAQAVRDFRAHVEDHHDQEGVIRRALGWLLNQPDATLDRLHRVGLLPYPTPDAASQRRYYETLWDAVFARWQLEDVWPAADVEVAGLP